MLAPEKNWKRPFKETAEVGMVPEKQEK